MFSGPCFAGTGFGVTVSMSEGNASVLNFLTSKSRDQPTCRCPNVKQHVRRSRHGIISVHFRAEAACDLGPFGPRKYR